MKAKWMIGVVAFVAVCGWATVAAYAADTSAGTAPVHHQVLTAEQRAAVKAIMTAAKTDLQALRADLKTEVQKLRGLRQSKAGADAIKAQHEVVKTKIAAIKARLEKVKDDVKAVLPPEAYQKWLQRWHEHMEHFRDHAKAGPNQQ